MGNFAVNMNTGGFPVQRGYNAQCGASQTNASEINKYDQLLLWQNVTQTALDESVLIEMETYKELAGTDQWDIKSEEVIQKYTDIAGQNTYTFTEEGKTYNECLETLAQEHVEAYDIIDADGKITFEEYKQSEILKYNAFLPQDETPVTEDNELAMQMFETSFNFMDLNGDKTIDKEEIKTYYTTADMLDGINSRTENPADKLDGSIKFSTTQKMSDLMNFTYNEGTQEYTNKENLRSAMMEIYKTSTGQDPAKPAAEKKFEIPAPDEPTEKGKIIFSIEEKLLSKNPFK